MIIMNDHALRKVSLFSHSFFLYFIPRYPAYTGAAASSIRNSSESSFVVIEITYTANATIQNMPRLVPYCIAVCSMPFVDCSIVLFVFVYSECSLLSHHRCNCSANERVKNLFLFTASAAYYRNVNCKDSANG